MSISNEQKTNIAIKEGLLSIFINTFLFAIKLSAGILSNSVALVADAWHTLTDSLSSIVLIFSMKHAKKGPDENHPYGHGRVELIAGLAIGIMLFVIAFD
ncbi:MAG: cation diffusion facilitator family transporter, partial [Lentisphaeria bacterium]